MSTTILTEADQHALNEVAVILGKHDLLNRFGVYFRHEHFPVAADEVVHEINDEQGRISLRRVLKANELPSQAFPTAWALSSSGAAKAEAWCCD